MSFKPIDSNRDEYRKYLERSGVIEALSKVLINLFHEQERPENAVDYLRMNIGDALKDRDTIESLKLQLADAKREIDELKNQLSTSHTVTVQTNTDGGGDATILQAPASNVSAPENAEIQGEIDTATTVTTSTKQSDNKESVVVEEKTTVDNTSVIADKDDAVKTDTEETAGTTAPPADINDQQPTVPAAATVSSLNDEEPSKDPPKNVE